MAIDVEWQDERGERVARYDGPPIDGRLPEHAPPESSCLRFIDPYGDTTFNAKSSRRSSRVTVTTAAWPGKRSRC
jgi:hypothetical protein